MFQVLISAGTEIFKVLFDLSKLNKGKTRMTDLGTGPSTRPPKADSLRTKAP